MGKRKLTKQQQWRIKKIQDERSRRADKKETQAMEQLDTGDLSPEQRGLVIAHYGQQLDVEALNGENKGQLHRCFVRANIDSLVTGDIVTWRAASDGSGIIVARNDRHTALKRPDKFGQLKPVAANIDQILIVIATEPEAHNNLIDRYLVAAEAVEISPRIILNKKDLINHANRERIEHLQSLYSSLGYDWVEVSSKSQEGLAPLQALLDDRISIFVGQSGVGKSSLIQALLPSEELRVGDLSESARKGTHTTTTAKLFHMRSGGELIDSPGIREFGLWHMDELTLADGFVEFRPFLGTCRFRDCRHSGEPGCALNQALEEGQIEASRMESYQRIRDSLEDQTIINTHD